MVLRARRFRGRVCSRDVSGEVVLINTTIWGGDDGSGQMDSLVGR